MALSNVSISLDSELLECLDRLVAEQHFSDRNKAVEEAIREKLERVALVSPAPEHARLVATDERAPTCEGLIVDAGEWPEY
jgi:metal-responsive CopG/Arc/MetJ family transcriptional regulator